MLLPSEEAPWWQLTWTADMPMIPRGQVGSVSDPPMLPGIVAKWVAPHDGSYALNGYADIDGVYTGSAKCGAPDGGAAVQARELPDPPWDPVVDRGSGFAPIVMLAGEAYYITFAYLSLSGGADSPPAEGHGIANISPIR